MISAKGRLTDKDYWEKRNNLGSENKIPFLNVIKKNVCRGDGKKKFLEIGCVPGFILGKICKELNYLPVGVDYVKDTKRITRRTLKKIGINNSEIFEKDFFKWESKYKYDVVSSFGFIEHFDNPEFVVKKHIDLIKNKGILILEVPNFSGIMQFLHKIAGDSNILKRHNLDVMNLEFFKRIAEENNLKIKYLKYYGGFNFWWSPGKKNLFNKTVYFFLRVISNLMKNIPMSNKLSPYIVFIARKG